MAGEWLLACLPHPWHFQGHRPLEQDELVAGREGKGSRGRPMRNRPGPRMQTPACSFTHSEVWAAHPGGPCPLEPTACGGSAVLITMSQVVSCLVLQPPWGWESSQPVTRGGIPGAVRRAAL